MKKNSFDYSSLRTELCAITKHHIDCFDFSMTFDEKDTVCEKLTFKESKVDQPQSDLIVRRAHSAESNVRWHVAAAACKLAGGSLKGSVSYDFKDLQTKQDRSNELKDVKHIVIKNLKLYNPKVYQDNNIYGTYCFKTESTNGINLKCEGFDIVINQEKKVSLSLFDFDTPNQRDLLRIAKAYCSMFGAKLPYEKIDANSAGTWTPSDFKDQALIVEGAPLGKTEVCVEDAKEKQLHCRLFDIASPCKITPRSAELLEQWQTLANNLCKRFK